MATCSTMTDANTLHWGVENSQFELPVEYILGPPGQGLFAQPCAEFTTMSPPNTMLVVCRVLILPTKALRILSMEFLPHSSPDDTMEIHDIGDIAQQMQKYIDKDLVEAKLRSASHKSKNSRTNSAVAPDVAKARNCHNKVEKQYRARLKTRFARLLAVLQESMPAQISDGNTIGSLDANYAYSRGEVLDLAIERILTMGGKQKARSSNPNVGSVNEADSKEVGQSTMMVF
ncbi:hypothetical protein NXS19_013041 [Fusarium pseudograminearum]|nr:hypothetical protein NXS19_013041 [Fusarium pseudograminearum]